MESENIDSIVRAFKNTVEQLFLVSDGMDRPYVDVIDESVIYTLGSSAASFYDAGGYNIAQYLDPEQKEALVDAAVKSGLFSVVKPYSSDDADDINFSSDEDWNVAVGEDSFNLYNKIVSHSSLTGGRYKPDRESYGSIYVYEFMDWLHLFNRSDKKNYEKLEEAIYEGAIDLIDNQKKQVLDDFFNSSVAVPGHKRYMERVYFEIQKERIKKNGFDDEVYKNLRFFDKYFKVYSGGSKDLYDTAIGNLSTLVIPDNNHLFIPSLRNIYKYFGDFPKTMRTILDVYISKKLKADMSGPEDVIDMFTALGVRSNIHDNGYEDSAVSCLLEEPFDNLDNLIEILEQSKGSVELPEKIKERMIENLEYYQLMKNSDEGIMTKYTSFDVIEDYQRAYRAFFGDEFDFMLGVDSAVKSLEKKCWRGGYVNSWDSIEPLTEDMSPDMKIHFWHEVFEKMEGRFYNELGRGDFDAIPFLNEVMGQDAEPLKEALQEHYADSVGATIDFYQYTDPVFLLLVNNYRLVCEEYPERFIKGFQRNIGGMIDWFISEEDRLENYVNIQSDAERINDALLLLGKPALKLLPELGEKVDGLSEVDPELSKKLIPQEWVPEKKVVEAVS
ncbi:hypothetical protein GQ472_04285 [archaeon]|nr:hypothetical protein [archaeon]